MARHPTATWIPSPNIGYPRGTKGQVKPIAKVYHIAAGSLTGMDNWFSNPNSEASAHFGIGKNGEIHQYADTLDACWHAGILNQPDLSVPLIKFWTEKRYNPNFFTIGIEHEGQSGDVPTAAQWQSTVGLSLWLDQVHPDLGDTRAEHLTHSQIDTINRAGDPGTGYDINKLTEAHHDMALTPAQTNNILMAELLPEMVELDAILTRMNLRLSGSFDKLEDIKRDGRPAMVELKKLLVDLRSQSDYAVFVQAINTLENKLKFFGV